MRKKLVCVCLERSMSVDESYIIIYLFIYRCHLFDISITFTSEF